MKNSKIVIDLGTPEAKQAALRLWAETDGWTEKVLTLTPKTETFDDVVVADNRAKEIQADEKLQWIGANISEDSKTITIKYNEIGEIDNPVTYKEAGIKALYEYLKRGNYERLTQKSNDIIEEAQTKLKEKVDKDIQMFRNTNIT